MKITRLFLIFILLFSSLSCGRPSLLQVSRTVLDNGLTVLICEKHELPLVSIKAQIRAGSLFEPEEKAGLASFVGRMLTKGTKTKNAEEIAEKIDFVGGSLSSWAGGNSSYVACEVLKKDLDLALDLVSDILINPSFASHEMEKEREFILSEIKAQKDNPWVVAQLEFNELVYGRHPYHRPVTGYEETVKKIRREDLIDFHQKYYAPNNTILAVVGDVDSETLIKKIKEKFGGWLRRAVEFPDFPAVLLQEEIKKKAIFMKKEQVQILLGHLGIRRTNPDYYALLVMDVILGAGGLSARIPYNLRDVKGLAYTAYSDIAGSAGLEPGQFVAYMAVSSENKDKAINGLLEEIRRIRNQPVSTRELEDAKSYLTGSYYFGLQGNDALTGYLLFCETYNFGFDFVKKYPQYINRITKEDVQRVAQNYLHPETYTLVEVGPLR